MSLITIIVGYTAYKYENIKEVQKPTIHSTLNNESDPFSSFIDRLISITDIYSLKLNIIIIIILRISDKVLYGIKIQKAKGSKGKHA